MSTAIRLNGVTCKALGITVRQASGLQAMPVTSYPELAVPGRDGVLRGSVRATQPREITLDGWLGAASPAALETARAVVLAQCGGLGGAVAVESDHAPARVYVGVLTVCEVSPQPPQFLAKRAPIRLVVRCASPFAADSAVTTVAAIGAVRKLLPQGTAPSAPIIQLAATANTPVLTLTDGPGTVLGTLTLSGTITGAQLLEVDCDALTIRSWNGAAWAAADSRLASGDFFTCDPLGGSRTLYLACTGGGTASASYAQRWC